jgi:hypothetical protein
VKTFCVKTSSDQSYSAANHPVQSLDHILRASGRGLA